MTSALLSLGKLPNGAPRPIVSVLTNMDHTEAALHRIITDAPGDLFFDGHGRFKPNVPLGRLPPSWSISDAAMCNLLLNWARPWSLTHTAKAGTSLGPLPDYPKLRPPVAMPGHALVKASGPMPATIFNVGNLQMAASVCQGWEGLATQDASDAQNAYNDALQQIQTASNRLTTAQTAAYQKQSFQQQTLIVQQGLNALFAWQNDHDKALYAINDVSASAALCRSDAPIGTAATQAQAFAGYFNDPAIQILVAMMIQTFFNIQNSNFAAFQRSQALQTQSQALYLQLSNCLQARTQWWGVQLMLDENCTTALYDFLNLIMTAGAVGGLSGLLSALPATSILPPPANLLVMLYWAVVALEAFLVSEVIKLADNASPKRGVTINISWIPLSADVLATLASGGAAAPEIPFIVEALEQATLVGELSNPGGGSFWYSFFWITSN
jgi:hypothetical protein